MTLELRGCEFFEFPVRHAAYAACTFEPFVSEPSCSAAVSGIVHQECFVAMCRNAGLVTHYIDGFNTVKEAAPGGPELYFLDQGEKLNPFAVISFCWFF